MPLDEVLLERTGEMAAIEVALEGALGGDGGCIVIEGPAGIGKSALLAAARRDASARGMTVVAARASELEEDFAYGVVRQLLERRVDADPRLLRGPASSAAALLGASGESDSHQMAGLAEPETEFAVVHALYWVVCNLADQGPVLLTVDDLQHCDVPSLRFLHYMARRLDGVRVALVIAVRPGLDDEQWSELLAALPGQALHPALLSAEASGRFVRERADEAPSPAFVEACHRASGGNPFLLTELLAAVRSDGLDWGDAAAASVASLSPHGVSLSVLFRLHGLPPEATRLARAIATFGGTAAIGEAARVAGMSTADAAGYCDMLVRVGVLSQGRPLAFVHPVIGEAVRGDTPHGEQVRLHRLAAELLAARGANSDQVAIHLSLTDEAGDPWVVEVLWAAGQAARASGASDVARRWLSRAVAEGVSPVPAALLRDLGEAEWLAGDPASALEHLRAATAAAASDLADRVATALLTARVQASVADFVAAAATVDGALADRELLATTTVRWLEAEAATYRLLNQEDADLVADRLVQMATPAGDTVADLVIQCSLAATRLLKGSAAQAVAFARRGLSDDRLLDAGAVASFPFMAALTAFSLAEDQDESSAVFDRVLCHAQDRGATTAITYVCAAAAIGAWICGDIRRCEQMTREALDAEFPVGYVRPILQAYLALALMEQGDLGGAAEAVGATGATGLDRDVLSASQSVHALYACGRLHRFRGQPEAALEVLRFRGDPGQAENHLPYPAWRLEAASCHLDLGQTSQAIALVREHAVHAERWATSAARGATRRLEALTELGEARLAGLAAAGDLLAGSPARLEWARCQVELGAGLRAAGRTQEARDVLRAAYDVAGRCGSTVLAEQARAELVVAGARPRRQHLTGVQALTASERRICELAAEGLTNIQIAQRLFVTRSTVEKHLGHAYDKLGVAARQDLVSLLEAEAEAGVANSYLRYHLPSTSMRRRARG
ncbi:MAG: AAA family ATPase [Actinomycetota bacterium]|nr:AAA family ATPase [Actinomycetota bacterium]